MNKNLKKIVSSLLIVGCLVALAASLFLFKKMKDAQEDDKTDLRNKALILLGVSVVCGVVGGVMIKGRKSMMNAIQSTPAGFRFY